MRFVVYGPYELKRDAYNSFEKKQNSELWKEVEKDEPGLSNACGCYVFRIVAGKGAKPWYVGKTERQTFKLECFSPRIMRIYDKAFKGRKSGTAELILLALDKKKKGGFRKPAKKDKEAIGVLELLLITRAFEKNPKLLNTQGTKGTDKKLVVEGILNTPRLAHGGPAKALRDTFRLPIHKQKLK